MAAINAIAREWADELREGITCVIVWKTGRRMTGARYETCREYGLEWNVSKQAAIP